MGRGALSVGLLLASCSAVEPLPWPPAPPAARSVLVIALGPDGPGVIARDTADPSSFTVPDGPLWLSYSGSTLMEQGLEAGPALLGDARALPAALATYERTSDGWRRIDDNDRDPRLAGIRLAEPARKLCLAAGGCYGLEPDPQRCNLPCPCPAAPLATEPYPRLQCPLPGPPRPTPCYRDRGPLPGIDAPGAIDMLGSIVDEAGTWILYFSTSRFGDPPTLARAELDRSMVVRSQTIAPVDLGLPPGFYAERPHVRADGLELWFQSNAPPNPSDRFGLWVASRRRIGDPFAHAQPVNSLNSTLEPEFPGQRDRKYPMLLGDYRTIMFRAEDGGILSVPRSSTIAGSVDGFDDPLLFSFAPGEGAISLSLGCDRQSILYLRTLPSPWTLMVAPLSTLVPLMLDNAAPAHDDQRAEFSIGDVEAGFVETPDCQHLLAASPNGVERYDIVECR